MPRTAEMFGKPARRPARVIMRCEESGSNGPGRMGRFICGQCGQDQWYSECSLTEIRRGMPCPVCNAEHPTPVISEKP